MFERNQLEEIDLAHEFSIMSSAIKVSLIETIDFIDKLINLDPSENKEDLETNISRNILFARLLITDNKDSDFNNQFCDALSKIDLVWGASEVNAAEDEEEVMSLGTFETKFRSNALPFHGLYPEKNVSGAHETKGIPLVLESSFDADGFSKTLQYLFDSDRLIGKDLDFVEKLSLELRLFSEEDFFKEARMTRLEMNDTALDEDKSQRLKEQLSRIFTEYFSSNYAMRERLSGFLNDNGLMTEQAVVSYYQENEFPPGFLDDD